jgi:hypothetical protein
MIWEASLALGAVGAAGWFGWARRLRRTNLLAADSPELGGAAAAVRRRELKRVLLRYQGVDGCERLAERATEQLGQVEERFRAFDRLLRSRLSPSELTFARYRTAAEQVALSVVDGLREVSDLAAGVAPTSPSEIRARLASPGQDSDRAALEQRLALVEQQQAKADALLAANEGALTSLDRVTAALAEMKTGATLASGDLEAAIAQLSELAGRAGRYSSGNVK